MQRIQLAQEKWRTNHNSFTTALPDLGLITRLPLKPVPFYPIREPAVRLVAGWYQFLDAIGR